MEQERVELILAVDRALREKYGTDIIFSGSFGLWLDGIDLGREFHDVDVKVVGADPRVIRKDKFDFNLPIDFLGVTDVPLEYKEIDFHGRKILVYTAETIMNIKKSTVRFSKTRKIRNIFTERTGKKHQADLDYIKEKYGME